MIVAHSAGGMVARTALLLDNHPRCAVNSIIMLSSPNSRYHNVPMRLKMAHYIDKTISYLPRDTY